MSKIKNYQDLLAVKKQLEAELVIKHVLIQKDMAELKQEWRPVTNLLSGIAKINSQGKGNPLVSMGIGIIGNLLLKNTPLARSGWIASLVVPFLAKNYSTHILNKEGTSIFRQLIDRFRNHKSNGQPVIENE